MEKDGTPLAEGVYGMPRTRIRPKFSRYSISILIVLAGTIGLLSATTIYGGIFYHTTSPTMTYSGYLGAAYYGIYHHVWSVPLCHKGSPPCNREEELVFYLDTGSERIRLIFYCGVVAYYCDNPDDVPLPEGSCILAKGTLLTPSKWPTNQFEPSLQFSGDLYVFQYSAASETSCS